jgi:X8 domain
VQKDNVTIRPNGLAVSSQFAELHRPTVSLNDYQPTVSPPASCTPMPYSIKLAAENGTVYTTMTGVLATAIPEVPTRQLCMCMQDSLQCIYNSTDPEAFGVYRQFCSKSWDAFLCSGAANNYTTGVFGAYNECTHPQFQSWILNQLYLSKGKDPSACTSANGTLQSAVKPRYPKSNCDILLRQAGPVGTGRITFTPDPLKEALIETNGSSSSKLKLGLAIGVTIFVLLVTGLSFGYYYRRRRRAKRSEVTETETEDKSELPDTSIPPNGEAKSGPAQIIELEDAAVHELDSKDQYELTADPQEVYELPADHIVELHDTSKFTGVKS